MTEPSKTPRTVEQRITDYLAGGGLFNPELANHDAVRDLLIDARDSLSETQSQLDGAKAVAEVVVRTAVGMGLYDGAASISGNKIIDLVKAMREKADYAEEIIRLVGEETAKAGKLHTEARRVMAMNEPAFAAVYCTLCELRDRIAALKRKTENANEHQASAVDVAAPQNVVLLGVRRADAAGPPVVRGEELRGRFAGAMVERGGGWVKVQRLSDEDADALVALLNGRTEIGQLHKEASMRVKIDRDYHDLPTSATYADALRACDKAKGYALYAKWGAMLHPERIQDLNAPIALKSPGGADLRHLLTMPLAATEGNHAVVSLPRDPTNAMLEAAFMVRQEAEGLQRPLSSKALWQAMYDAAPQTIPSQGNGNG